MTRERHAVAVQQVGQPLLSCLSAVEMLKKIKNKIKTETQQRECFLTTFHNQLNSQPIETNLLLLDLATGMWKSEYTVVLYLEYTVKSCMMCCRRLALAIMWLRNCVCWRSNDSICARRGSSSSHRSHTRKDWSTNRNSLGTALSAAKHASQTASLK